jgi:hypothetical protein
LQLGGAAAATESETGVGGVLLRGVCWKGSVGGALVALYHGISHARAPHFRIERPSHCWRAFSLVIGVGGANEAPSCHLVCHNVIRCAVMTLIRRNGCLNQIEVVICQFTCENRGTRHEACSWKDTFQLRLIVKITQHGIWFSAIMPRGTSLEQGEQALDATTLVSHSRHAGGAVWALHLRF